jgi:hypothetical protein
MARGMSCVVSRVKSKGPVGYWLMNLRNGGRALPLVKGRWVSKKRSDHMPYSESRIKLCGSNSGVFGPCDRKRDSLLARRNWNNFRPSRRIVSAFELRAPE